MSEFCQSRLARDNGKNQCAHYVSHMLGYQYGAGCNSELGTEESMSIRVNEVFNEMSSRGYWEFRPASFEFGLAILTVKKAVDSRNGSPYITSLPQKHIGILLGGRIYNYNNPKDIVHAETPNEFFQGNRAQYYSRKANSEPVGLYATLG